MRTRTAIIITACLAGGGALLTAQTRVTSVDGRAELTDPAGDVKPIVYLHSVGSGPQTEVKFPGLDVVKLAVSSDGKAITLTATLTAPPAKAASEVIEFYVDADNNPKTGVTHPDSKLLAGVEFHGALEACIEHELFGTRCATNEERPHPFMGVLTLEKFGKDWPDKDTLFDIPAGKGKEPRKTPVKGPVVEASVDYGAMGLKSGQTIRLVAREFNAGLVNNVGQGYLPEILLTLK